MTDDDVVAYRSFWLCEDGKWFATIEKDGVEWWRRGPFATAAEAKTVSDQVSAIMLKYKNRYQN
jgi:hypothetical protein